MFSDIFHEILLLDWEDLTIKLLAINIHKKIKRFKSIS